ncbi:MAG: hypothetical protein KIS83_11070 [Rubrivivax sp.]|nr:hypothetical protein [Rubrivivax sp.]
MRQPPPVSVRCSGGRPWRALNLGLPALAAAALAAWVAGHATPRRHRRCCPRWRLASAAAFAATRWLPAPADLVWDGQAWSADGTPGTLDIAIDAGPWMLLRLRPAAGAYRRRWLPLSAAEAGPAWHALRVAAFATAGRAGDGLVAAATGAAPPGR